VVVRDNRGALVGQSNAKRLRDPALARPPEPRVEAEPELVRKTLAVAAAVEHDRPAALDAERRIDEQRDRLPFDGGAEQVRVEVGDQRPERVRQARSSRDVAIRRVAGPARESSESARAELLQRDDHRPVLDDPLHHRLKSAPLARRQRSSVEEIPAPDEHAASVFGVRVVLADPPAYTPYYDHELASALAREGADVEVVTSRFRFAELPEPTATGVTSSSTRSARASFDARDCVFRSRRPSTRSGCSGSRAAAPTSCTCSGSLRRRWTSGCCDCVRRRCSRRTTSSRGALRRSATLAPALARFDRVVVHSERGRETLADLGVDARVIPLPIDATTVERADDGRTLLFFGVIRPYKGLPDALEVVRRIDDARLLVAGDPVEPVDRDGSERVEWRLGYLPDSEVDRALSEGTVALFPYRPELDQSAALARRHWAPAFQRSVYDVNGIAEPVKRFGAGRVVPAGRRRRAHRGGPRASFGLRGARRRSGRARVARVRRSRGRRPPAHTSTSIGS
jgi:glycosyltransferase involved in cell wall biosynthesis